ncbi:MAG: DUF542 domain-containing protein [Acidobacteria bacterium]|nr:DUF542 domain-containing protein [Acidobacteriota bacterium]
MNTSSSDQTELARRTLGELVARDFRAATVFEQLGFDYERSGHQTLQEAAAARGVGVDTVVQALQSAGLRATGRAGEGLDELIRHIVERHHQYVRESTPRIRGWLDSLVEQEIDAHPEFADVREIFRSLSDALGPHMVKEEHILFPFIHEMAAAARAGTRPSAGPFGTLLNPIRVMEADHFEAESLMTKLSALTHGYAVPAGASPTHSRCYEELARFEQDLVQHVRLENDVLFPGAIALEGLAN